MSHTPTPWKVQGATIVTQDDERWIISDVYEPSPGNLAHIVKCVNAHDSLKRRVAELEDLRDELLRQCNNAIELGATGPGFYEDLRDTILAKVQS